MGKLLILDKDDIRELEFEEVLTMYKGLIKTQMWKVKGLNMEYEDKLQVAKLALWKAYENYNIETEIGFGQYATRAVMNDLIVEYKRGNRHKRTGLVLASIDELIAEDITLLDAIASPGDFEEDLIIKSGYERFINKISDNQKEVISLFVTGKNYREIAKILNVGATTISMRMTAAKKIFKQSMAI